MAKSINAQHFQTISQALLNRKRLMMTYYNRQDGSETSREISPQRLIRYRDSWYLDAWCHLRQGLRSFSVDAVRQLEIIAQSALDADENQLSQELESGYGIFSGVDTEQAVLRFSPKLARWVSHELWHPEQTSEYDDKGYFILRVPFSHDTELLMDILKHGAQVEVLEPLKLRKKVLDAIVGMKKLYSN
jgi:predicted DNA-binding transcriptional regulator YafY